jgi:hypothetical protein
MLRSGKDGNATFQGLDQAMPTVDFISTPSPNKTQHFLLTQYPSPRLGSQSSRF